MATLVYYKMEFNEKILLRIVDLWTDWMDLQQLFLKRKKNMYTDTCHVCMYSDARRRWWKMIYKVQWLLLMSTKQEHSGKAVQ